VVSLDGMMTGKPSRIPPFGVPHPAFCDDDPAALHTGLFALPLRRDHGTAQVRKRAG
jgi:hypothetical protein